MIVDTFMVRDELDMLECRLDTMSSAVDWFVVIEADVDHQGHPKPYVFAENRDRFRPWLHKIIDVQATNLPTTPHHQDPWSREWAQRDWVWDGLARIPRVDLDTIVLHGDVDEICRPLYVRNIRPKARQFITFGMDCYCFAVDWKHPDPWGGTVAVTVETARMIGNRHVVDGVVYHPGAWQIVRNQRNGLIAPNFEHLGGGWRVDPVLDAGWHFSWLGGRDEALNKLGSFCHPEIAERTRKGLERDLFMREGFHVDGRKLEPVKVDDTWPPYIYEKRCPDVWFRR